MNRWKDWYEQGKRDLEKARLKYQNRYYEWAGFTSPQAAEKVIKSLGLKLGITLWGHSLNEMFQIISRYREVPADLFDKAKLLDLFYIPPRYPNGFASGKPADYFTKRNAEEAIDAADSITKFCESHLLK